MSNDNRSASQRIEDLEKASVSLYQALESFSKELGLNRETTKLLSNKVDAIVKVAASGSAINDESVVKAMIQNNVVELKEKVNDLIKNGVLVSQDAVDETSFVVAREIDDQGNEVNPRVQFALGALQKELQDKVKGSKAGDVLNLQEGKLKLQIMETYSIKAPQPPEAAAETDSAPADSAPADSSADAASAAPEAPTAEVPAAETSAAPAEQPAQAAQ